jgi:hypothetical protein
MDDALMPRGDQVQHPSGWVLRFENRQAEVGWKNVVAQAPGNAAEAWESIVGDPRRRTQRQHRLKGSLQSNSYKGRLLEQWQYEVTSGGRLWYLIDDADKTIWLVMASTRHPKATE